MADELDMDALALIGGSALVAEYRKIWPGGGWPAKPEGKRLAKAVLTAIDLPAIIRKAKAEAFEDAAGLCESHMVDCLEDRDVKRRWPEIEARNNVYAQAIRQRAGEEVK